MEATTVLTAAQQQLDLHRQRVSMMKTQNPEVLQFKTHPKSWSAIECLEHLNLTYQYYLPQINKSIATATPVKKGKRKFKRGFFGKMMIKNIQPQQGRRKFKMKTFKGYHPASDLDTDQVLSQYLGHLNQLEKIISQASRVDLNQVKVTSLIGPILRFKLGDCISFLLAHDARHLLQAEEMIKETGNSYAPLVN